MQLYVLINFSYIFIRNWKTKHKLLNFSTQYADVSINKH
jgi:hypothetical protein